MVDPRESRVRLVSLADEAGRVWLVDTFHIDVSNILPLLEGRTLVAHNAAFDLGFLWQAGFRPSNPVLDTMILSRLLYAGDTLTPLRKGHTSHSLEAVCKRELDIELDKSHQKDDWSRPLSLSMLSYAAEDARVLRRLLKPLETQIEAADLSDTAALEARALPAVLWLRASGVPIDEEAWRAAARRNQRREGPGGSEKTPAGCQHQLEQLAASREGLFRHRHRVARHQRTDAFRRRAPFGQRSAGIPQVRQVSGYLRGRLARARKRRPSLRRLGAGRTRNGTNGLLQPQPPEHSQG